MIATSTAKYFEEMGGVFKTAPILLSKKLLNVKALVFDWDGVWHDGKKDGTGKSSFNEVDSMGLNLLRFAYFLQNATLPKTIIITGEKNYTGFDFAEREHLDMVMYSAKNKVEFLQYMLAAYKLQAHEILFVFDDVLDFGMAAQCGARFFVGRNANPLLNVFAEKNNLFDYKTAHVGGQYAVREVCDLAMGLLGNYNQAIAERMAFSTVYQRYWAQRNQLVTRYVTKVDGGISEVNRPD